MRRTLWASAIIWLSFCPAVLLGQVVKLREYRQVKTEPEQLPPPQKDEDSLKPEELAPLPQTDEQKGWKNARSPILLQHVLFSVQQHYPLLIAARQEREKATGQLLAAQGQFDLQLNGHTLSYIDSFDNQRYRVGFTQPTPYQGISFRGGYRLGAGDYPVYYQDRQTAEGGEFSLGFTAPILKDRALDSRRGTLQKAQLDRTLAEPTIAEQRINFYRDASKAYWNWVAAARRVEIAKHLTLIAESRDSFLRKMAKRGSIAAIEVTDNLRTVYDRRTRLVRLQREFEQASFALSLFFRDEKGMPFRVDDAKQAPAFPVPLAPVTQRIKEQIALALRQRPELQSLQLQQEKVQVDLRLADNQRLPQINAIVNVAQDVGQEKSSLDRNTFEAGLVMEVPLQRRQAQGRSLAARARLTQIHARTLFIQERITAQVQSALSAVLRAYEAQQRAKRGVELARTMEEAETRKLQLGKSSILIVNLRELARADAQALEINALVDYFNALADFKAVLGLSHPNAILNATPCLPTQGSVDKP